MFCKYCGYEYQNDNVKFCPSCGKKLKDELTKVVSSNSLSVNPKEPKVVYYDLSALCMQFKFDSSYCEFVCPTNETKSSKCSSAIKKFNIDNKERIYLIYDTTFLGLCAHGFAICSSGIYGRDEYNKNFYIRWDKFKSCVYKKSLLGNLKIDDLEFSMPIITSENDIKSIIQIFDAIKSSI